MQTKAMHEQAAPWLEFYPTNSSTPEITTLERFPITIGRNESCDLHVDSVKVSREHAVIEHLGDVYRVRDLGSTNGTFVNGQQVHESPLTDGDLIVIANVEFSFRQAKAATSRKTATQVMGASSDGDDGTALDIIRGVRGLQESLTQCGARCQFQPIVRLDTGAVFGYEAVLGGVQRATSRSDAVTLLLATECRLTGRLRQLQRLIVAENAVALARDVKLLLNVDPSEIGGVSLADSLARLRELVSDDGCLVLEIPDSAVCDIPYFRDFLRLVRQLGIGVAYDGFAGGRAQVIRQQEIPPDYLKLSASFVRDIHRNANRQRQLRAVAEACDEVGCELIATGVWNANEADVCRELGCGLAQGDYFGAPSLLPELLAHV